MEIDLTWSAATHAVESDLWISTVIAVGLVVLLARWVAQASTPWWYLSLTLLAGLIWLYALPMRSPDLWAVARSAYWPYAAHMIARLGVAIVGVVAAIVWRQSRQVRRASIVPSAT